MTSPFEALRLAGARKPARIVTLPDSAFVDRPKGLSSAVGLRLLSEAEYQSAKSEASHLVERLYTPVEDNVPVDVEAATDAWSDHLVALAVAAATTDPNDASSPWLEAAPDRIQRVLTPEGLRVLWDALEVLHVEHAPTSPSIADEDLEALFRRVTPEALAALIPSEGLRARRLLAAVGELLPQ